MNRERPEDERHEAAALDAALRELVGTKQYAAFEADTKQREFYVDAHRRLLRELRDRLGDPSQSGLSIAAAHASIALYDALRGLEGDQQGVAEAMEQASELLYPLYPVTDHAIIDCICAEVVARKLSENN